MRNYLDIQLAQLAARSAAHDEGHVQASGALMTRTLLNMGWLPLARYGAEVCWVSPRAQSFSARARRAGGGQ